MQFNFTKQFQRIGEVFVNRLSKEVKNQKSIDGSSYSPPAPSTLKARSRRKSAKTGKATKSSTSTKRLWVTGEFGNEAFGFKSSATGVSIFAREVSHLDGISYAQILRYNSQGQKDLNRNIKRPPLVFPTNKSEILLMDKEFRLAKNIFAKEAEKQLREKAKINIRLQLNIG